MIVERDSGKKADKIILTKRNVVFCYMCVCDMYL